MAAGVSKESRSSGKSMATRQIQGQYTGQVQVQVQVTNTRDILSSAPANFLVQGTFRISYTNFGNLKKGKKEITPKMSRLYLKN